MQVGHEARSYQPLRSSRLCGGRSRYIRIMEIEDGAAKTIGLDREEPAIKVGFACVTEGRIDWAQKVFNLVASVRALGGPVANAPIVVNVVGGADRRFRAAFAGLDVVMTAVEPFDVRFPHANKLRMFEHLEHLDACDVLVALDCDIVVATDPAPLVSATHIRAKPEDATILSPEHWLLIYEHMGIEPPVMDVRMTSTGQVTYPWWNSGVVSIPLDRAEQLHRRWSDNVRRVAEIHDRTPNPLPANWITDQIAFVCSLLHEDLPFEPLPIWGNFPTCFPILPEFLESEPRRPIFVHYHHHVDKDGFLRSSGFPATDAALERVNELRSAHFGQPYLGLDSLESTPSRVAKLWAGTQRRLARQGWYRSPALRKVKSAIVNLTRRQGV